MKQILEPDRIARVDESRVLAKVTARSRPLCPAPSKDLRTPGESVRPLSDGAVWMFLGILLLTLIIGGYLFWAKLNTAWPFAF
jgi:hypothetical protein